MKSDILFKTQHHVALTRKDGDTFSDALRAVFPAIRFLFSNYTQPWIDEEASRERLRLKNIGALSQDASWRVMRHPGDDPLHCIQSLGDAVRQTTVWVEPPGWRPQWSSTPNREGLYTIVNRPQFEFEFTRSRYITWHHRRAFDEPPDELPRDEILVLDCDRLWARYQRDDKEQLAFLRKVWRILDKVTTSTLAYCDRETLEPLGISSMRDIWAGFDALEWVRGDHRHYIYGGGIFYRPPECLPANRIAPAPKAVASTRARKKRKASRTR